MGFWQILRLSNNYVSNSRYYDKVRLLFLAVIAQEGIKDSDRQKYLELARLDLAETQALTNMSMVGVRLSQSIDKRKNEIRV
jgi:syntaxin-binding protein 1